MTATAVEQTLAAVESCLDDIGQALQDNQAAALQQASEQLRLVAVQLTQLLDGSAASLAPDLAARVRSAGLRLGSQRDAIARMSAAIERQVGVVLPEQAPASTYGAAPGTGKGNAARIYRSAG